MYSERFLSKVIVDPLSQCWNWKAARNNRGYGLYWADGHAQRAYSYAFIQKYGAIKKGLHLDHRCNNTSCVNPDHLEPVTPRENILRGNGPCAKNARKTHCPKGHELVQITGRRYCRTCHNLIANKARKEKRAVCV